jgi:hypothetical protein
LWGASVSRAVFPIRQPNVPRRSLNGAASRFPDSRPGQREPQRRIQTAWTGLSSQTRCPRHASAFVCSRKGYQTTRKGTLRLFCTTFV